MYGPAGAPICRFSHRNCLNDNKLIYFFAWRSEGRISFLWFAGAARSLQIFLYGGNFGGAFCAAFIFLLNFAETT